MSYKLPISAKGILINSASQILLMRNERGDWELPGGRLEPNEQLEETLIREMKEETNLDVTVNRLIDTWVYEVIKDRFVLIVAYQCHFNQEQVVSMSDEHIEFNWFHYDQFIDLDLDEGYRNAIFKCLE